MRTGNENGPDYSGPRGTLYGARRGALYYFLPFFAAAFFAGAFFAAFLVAFFID
jgi:hypothetical protein